eukprot:TRINITY_DN9796_c0_g1_i1.p1 TRINITY_DN9796_c0_g1~~TRINITY_DN9796_c0_g1_i1.p1  ORF type:complete len:145 (-),score=4.44 TRINITY_DN9796_c0_g1_i1:106-540(-)
MANHVSRGFCLALAVAGLIIYIVGFVQGKDKLGSLLNLFFSQSAWSPFYILAILGGVQTLLYFIYWMTKKRGIFAVNFVLCLINVGMASAVAYLTGLVGLPCNNCGEFGRPIVLMFVGALVFGVSQFILPWTGHHHKKGGYIQL